MSQASKHANRRAYLVALIVGQLLCVAFGLGFYHNYVRSSIQQTLEQDARTQLTWPAQQTAHAIGTMREQQPNHTQSDDASNLKKLAATQRGSHYCLTLVDSNWRVLAQVRCGSDDAVAATPLAKIDWLRSSARTPASADPIRGSIAGDDGSHVAVAHPISNAGGYVVAHRSAKRDAMGLERIRPILWAATGITSLWLCGMMGAMLYMVTSYFHGDSRKHSRPDGDALKQAQALLRTQETVIFGLAKLSDSRDPETGDHLDRIAYYSTMLASALRQHPDFCEIITPSYVHLIGLSSALHDIGKVGVEDAILRKPASLTPEERTRMKEHTRVGEDCLKEIERRLGTSNFLQMAREIASAHHERWDGTGYPRGLAGEQIPLAARIVAIADVYDALSSKRVYKEAIPHELCVSMIAEETGRHFDPRLVEVFLQMEEKFHQVARQFGVIAHMSRAVDPSEIDTCESASQS